MIVGAVVLAGLALALNHALIGVVYDDGLYAGAAIALSHGLGHVHQHLPGTPAVVHFPPLYPLLLAPIFGTMPLATAGFIAKAVNLIIAALAAGLIPGMRRAPRSSAPVRRPGWRRPWSRSRRLRFPVSRCRPPSSPSPSLSCGSHWQ